MCCCRKIAPLGRENADACFFLNLTEKLTFMLQVDELLAAAPQEWPKAEVEKIRALRPAQID